MRYFLRLDLEVSCNGIDTLLLPSKGAIGNVSRGRYGHGHATFSLRDDRLLVAVCEQVLQHTFESDTT